MKKFKLINLILLTGLLATSCGSDDDGAVIQDPVASCTDGIQNQDETGVDCGGVCQACDENPDPTPEPVTLGGLIETDYTMTNDRIYYLGGKVVMAPGTTLTIEPGTIIKGEKGSGSLASALVIQRGAKINAVGTAEQPIIFTSEDDNIEVGQIAGTNLDENDQQLWGGVLILGNAPASLAGDVVEKQIEGIPAGDDYGLYGGDDATDDSGDIAYISIRHGGAIIGESNEINGLTLGGVGSETSISNVEIVGNEDDGIEIFGGTVNVSNVLVWAGGDDGIDLDQAWTGTMDNAIVIQGLRSDSALELDGPEGSLNGSYTLRNITLIGNTDDGEGNNRRIADFRDGLQATIENIYVSGFFPESTIRLNGNKSAVAYNTDLLVLSDWEIVLPDGVATVDDILATSDVTEATTFLDDADTFATAVAEGEQTVGADTSAFSWTYANAKAELGF